MVPMAQADLSTTPKDRVLDRFGQTGRTDSWWAGSLATALGLGAFIVYSTFRALYNGEYDFGEASQLLAGLEAANQPTDKVASHAHLLSPFYSPTIIWPGMPKWLSPAFLILWAPGGFRLTCYYYRKAYYRAFFLDPAGCAVGEPSGLCGFKRGRDYKGETRMLVFQNLHRYFLYVALAFIVLLYIDVQFPGPVHHDHPAGLLHLLVPFAAAPDRRQAELFPRHRGRQSPASSLDVGLLAEPQSHVVRVAEPVHGRILRLLRLDGRSRPSRYPPVLVTSSNQHSPDNGNGQVRNP